MRTTLVRVLRLVASSKVNTGESLKCGSFRLFRSWALEWNSCGNDGRIREAPAGLDHG